jgi:ATP-dependent DNA ligase
MVRPSALAVFWLGQMTHRVRSDVSRSARQGAGPARHWARPELVAEVKYLTRTEDNLLRQMVYEGLREDKPALRSAWTQRFAKFGQLNNSSALFLGVN